MPDVHSSWRRRCRRDARARSPASPSSCSCRSGANGRRVQNRGSRPYATRAQRALVTCGGGANTLRCALGKRHRTAISLGCVTPREASSARLLRFTQVASGGSTGRAAAECCSHGSGRPGIHDVGVRVGRGRLGSGARRSALGVTVVVRDTGRRAGREVVQAHVEPHSLEWGRPLRTLAAFAAVTAKPGRATEARLAIPARAFALRRGVRQLGPPARRVHRPHRQIFG